MRGPGDQAFLRVDNLAKRYPASGTSSELVVFEQLSFTVAAGEFVSVVGHSGCGKSTILSIIAGLASASAGSVFMNGRVVTGPGLARGVIFQNHSLLPGRVRLEM